MQRPRWPTVFGLPADLSECGSPARQPADLSECRPTWLEVSHRGSHPGQPPRADGPAGKWCVAAPVLCAPAPVPPSHGRARSRQRRSVRPPIQRSGTDPRRRQPGHAPSLPSLFRGGGLHRSRGRGARGNGSSDRHSRPTGRTSGSAAATRSRPTSRTTGSRAQPERHDPGHASRPPRPGLSPSATIPGTRPGHLVPGSARAPRSRARVPATSSRAQLARPAPNPGTAGRTRRWTPLTSMSSRITRARVTSAWSRVIVRAIQSM